MSEHNFECWLRKHNKHKTYDTMTEFIFSSLKSLLKYATKHEYPDNMTDDIKEKIKYYKTDPEIQGKQLPFLDDLIKSGEISIQNLLKRKSQPQKIKDAIQSTTDRIDLYKKFLEYYTEKLGCVTGGALEEPKKRGRPAKLKPSDEPIELDRNEYAHARIRKDDEYMGIIKDLWHKQTITTAQMNNMMGDLEDNKYTKLEKALSKYTTAKPVLKIPSREAKPTVGYFSPTPTKAESSAFEARRARGKHYMDAIGRLRYSGKLTHDQMGDMMADLSNEEFTKLDKIIDSLDNPPSAPKKRGRPPKPVDTTELKKLINEINEHKKHNPVTLASLPDFPKATRSEIGTLKKKLKSKAKHLISDIEHSDLMKYISQF